MARTGRPKVYLTEEERKEARRLSNNKYLENNKEKFRENKIINSRRYRENNKEKVAESKRRWREKHPEAQLIYRRTYRETEKGKEAQIRGNRKSREEMADWYIRQLISQETFKEYGTRLSATEVSPEIVELKREALTFKRIVKSYKS